MPIVSGSAAAQRVRGHHVAAAPTVTTRRSARIAKRFGEHVVRAKQGSPGSRLRHLLVAISEACRVFGSAVVETVDQE